MRSGHDEHRGTAPSRRCSSPGSAGVVSCREWTSSDRARALTGASRQPRRRPANGGRAHEQPRPGPPWESWDFRVVGPRFGCDPAAVTAEDPNAGRCVKSKFSKKEKLEHR